MHMNQLIILGNGLDLSVKLETRYEDFIDYLRGKIGDIDWKTEKGTYLSSIYNKYTSEPRFAEEYDFWLGWFLKIRKIKFKNNNLEWNDVENQISYVLRYIEGYTQSDNFAGNMGNLLDNFMIVDRSALDQTIDDYYEDWSHYLLDVGEVKDINEKIDIYDLLAKELTKFEQKFAQYLSDVVMSKERISKLIRKVPGKLYDRRKLLKNIINDCDFSPENTQILNFNYTPIFRSEFGIDSDFEALESNIQYIHGSLKVNADGDKCIPDSVIFGIDDTSLINQAGDEDKSSEERLYKFGKTYRILNSKEDASLDLEKKIDMIKFYGHSLNAADYSYFQSIFDKVDLYGSNVKLCFYYGDFEKDDAKNKRAFMDRIYKLIETYGQNTFKNGLEIRGKNLLHKLILEGRVKTYYIK